jgi:hypothetical protein
MKSRLATSGLTAGLALGIAAALWIAPATGMMESPGDGPDSPVPTAPASPRDATPHHRGTCDPGITILPPAPSGDTALA